MFLAILIINILSVLVMTFILLTARGVFLKRRYLICSLTHNDHPPEHCKDLPIGMGPVKTYIILQLILIFLSFFLYYNF